MTGELDKKIIRLIQGDLPLESQPFAAMAESIGLTESQFIRRVRELKEAGVIRRFGATLRHQEAGFGSNAMVAWLVPNDKVEEVGRKLAQFQEVTHCYQRRPQKDWKYNIYTMIHGSTRKQCHQIAARMSKSTGMINFKLLFSEQEFKKTSMEYF